MYKRGNIVKLVILTFFILLSLGIYFNSLHNDFHYDDLHHIQKNFYIRDIKNIPLFFTEPRTFSALSGIAHHYRPLVMVSYAVNYYFGKLNPMGYHLVNLGFHAGSAFLLFLIIEAMLRGGGKKLSLFPPLTAGLLFLTTPYNSEVVNYVAARSTVMSAFFYLLSFYCWVKFRSEKLEVRSTMLGEGFSNFLPLTSYFYLASFLAFLFAILTKEIAITLPAILILYDLYFGKVSTRAILSYVPFAFLGVFSVLVVRMAFFGAFLGAVQKNGVSDFNFIIKVKALGKYLYHSMVPVQLSVQHLIDNSPNLYFYLALIMVIGLAVLAFYLWRSPDALYKRVSFFILWFFIVLVPVMAVSLNEPYQENRGYMAVVGLVGVVAVGLERLRERWPAKGAPQKVAVYLLLGGLVVLYSTGTIIRNSVWHNELTLWSDVIKKYPESTNAHFQLGFYYNSVGEIERAEAEYKTILGINPKESKALAKLGALYYRKGNIDSGMDLLQNAMEIAPYDMNTNFLLANIYSERGEYQLSSGHLLFLLNVSPHDPRLFERLIENYNKMGKVEEVYNIVSRALAEDSNNPGAHRALGLIYMHQDRWSDAQKEYERVLSYIPRDYETLKDLAYVYFNNGEMGMAEKTIKQALIMQPSDHMMRFNLARVYVAQGRKDLAREELQKVLLATSKGDSNKEIYNSAQRRLTALQ